MTKNQFLNLQIDKVSQVYYGVDNCCRCGCAGTYYATEYMINPRSDVNTAKARKLLEQAQERAMTSRSVEYGDTYVNVPFGKKAICVYFDEV